MEKIYEYELSEDDLTKLGLQFDKIIKLLEGDDFKKFLGDKLKEGLKFIQRTSLTTVNNDIAEEMSKYMNSNHLEIENDYIYIYNDAEIDISKKYMKPTTKKNYPAKLSLAKIVEYGIGYTGGMSTLESEVEDWEYDVNSHGYKGWYYIDESGAVHWTNGYQGRFIFYKLKQFVEAYIQNWINEYLDNNL